MANKDRVAWVTGANRGIGLEIARQLTDKGIHVVSGARSIERGKTAAKKLAPKRIEVFPMQLDVTDHW